MTIMNKLDQLRSMTEVVADTGDIVAIKKYQPLDATTNPSLLLKACEMPQYEPLIQGSIAWLKTQTVDPADAINLLADKFAVDIGQEILNIVPGRISTEVDARLSFDRDASIARARRLIEMYQASGIKKDRVLIKLAATWEGIEAARILQQEGIDCNLTLMFSIVQAVAAAEAKAFLISPFVGRIMDWYKQAEGKDGYPPNEDPGVISVRDIYALFKDRGYPTVVMGASFRNVGEIEALAGCDRLTIGPNFLEELAQDHGTLERQLFPDQKTDYPDCNFVDEADFRLQLNENAMATEKLAGGIRSFVVDQIKLEAILNKKMSAI